MREYNYILNKQQFWDSIRLRYGWSVPGLPSKCPCGENFNIQHAMSCKKGGYVTIRHNEIRDITAKLLSELCKDVAVEPSLLKLNGEQETMRRTAKNNDDVRLDISEWVNG